jgi:LytR cell envelope-related transcriptional attenuator
MKGPIGLPRGGAIVPGRAFWGVVVAVALGCGLAIGYLGAGRDVGVTTLEATEEPTGIPGTESGASGARTTAESNATREARTGDRFGRAKAPVEGLITEGVSVQVLNASGRRKADNRVAKRLRRLGFEIVAVNPASKIYNRTTVFWSRPEGRSASRTLARHYSWRSAPRPKNLSPSVTTHVVVGRDEA